MADYHLNFGYDYSAASPSTSLQWGVVSVSNFTGTNSSLAFFQPADTLEIFLYDLTSFTNPGYTLPNNATATSPINPTGSWMTFTNANAATPASSSPFTIPTGLVWQPLGKGNPAPTWPAAVLTYPCWTLAGFSVSMSTVSVIQSWLMTVSINVQLVNGNQPISNTTKTFSVDPEMIVRPT